MTDNHEEDKPSPSLTGNTPKLVIVDDALAATLASMDFSDVELRVMSAFGMPEPPDLSRALSQFEYSVDRLGSELRCLSSIFEDMPKPMTRDEQQHSDHPRERNPNHPRFQKQPRSTRQRK